jgi:hypothetical protein
MTPRARIREATRKERDELARQLRAVKEQTNKLLMLARADWKPENVAELERVELAARELLNRIDRLAQDVSAGDDLH